MIEFPNINPVFFKIGSLELRWYGLMYILGIGVAFGFLRKELTHRLQLNSDQILNLMTSVMIGIVLGGRLGYVIVYDLKFYLKNPAEILAYWHGGMSYHGGAFGAVIALFLFSRKYKIDYAVLFDYLGIGSTFGLFFGRIGNFINGELFGRVTDVGWGMIFPNGGPYPRHPSQLYEAIFEGVFLFLILFWIMKKKGLRPGQLFCVYLAGYSVFRFGIEFFREPDGQLGLFFNFFSMGQLLCAAMMISAAVLFRYFMSRNV